MIKLNGYVCIDGKDMYFEDFEIEIEEELELPFDFLIDDEDDYCEGDCDDCEFFDEDEDELDDNVDALLEMYVDVLDDSCGCPECTKEILLDFIKDFVDILVE